MRIRKPLACLVLALGVHLLEEASAGSTNLTTLQTGNGNALLRITLPIVVPTNYSTASVQFEFSFVTDERLIPGDLLDSFTISVRNTNRTVVAAALTVDRYGVTFAPISPGAVQLAAKDLEFEPAPAPADASNFLFHASYSVAVNLPHPLLTEPAVLVLSLFDNQDDEFSRAVVSNVRVKLGLTARIALESSAAVAGPYALEGGAAISHLRQTLSIPKTGRARFFRLHGETASRIKALRRNGVSVELDYEAELGELDLLLLGANNPAGPYFVVSNAQFNLAARTISVPLLNAPGFFRMGGSHPARIINDEVTGNQRVLEFDVRPKVPQLESSAQVAGPYAREETVLADPFAQKLAMPQGGTARFYRINAEIPLTIRGITTTGEYIVISYEEP